MCCTVQWSCSGGQTDRSALTELRAVLGGIGIAAGRVLRRWYRSKNLIKQVTVVRVEQATGRVSYRRSHK
jgi:hypothetical protein